MFFQRYGLYLAWVLSCFGAMLSLYFSEIRHVEPCHLCWYQRIALFPLMFILGIAAYRGSNGIGRYVLPQVVIGFLFAAYQVALQEIPGWNPIEMCGAGPNCAEKVDIGLGFITIPMLSITGFFLIGVLVTGALVSQRRSLCQEN